MNLKLATIEDFHGIYDLLLPYRGESFFKGKTVNREHATRHIYTWLEHCHVVLAFDGEAMAGIVVVTIDHTFFDEKEADIDFMFVSEKYRKTEVSRLLRDEAIRIMDENNCEIQYAYTGSGVQERLFVNLFAKVGFAHLGTLLVRDLTKLK